MTRINALCNIAGTRDSVAWGKFSNIATATWGNINALVFAAALIACSVTVGCSSEQPKSISSSIQIPPAQMQNPTTPAPAPVMQVENKTAPKKVVHRKPATVNYSDKTYGVAFEYPRRYAIETGDAASELVLSSPLPMNFVQPGGVALAAVELPETGFANTDFSSAFFNVSVNKTLTADQCNEFAVPQTKELPATPMTNVPESGNQVTAVDAVKPSDSAPAEGSTTDGQSAKTTTEAVATASPAPQVPVQSASQPAPEAQGSKLLVGDLGLRATEAVSGEGTRQSDSKYFHVYQNGACYEFALNVTTVASQDGLIKHVDRDRVFDRLEKILATVKINPVAAPEVTAETPATPTAPITAAQ
ncbi:MAG: hypothetical protein WAN03_11965 [Candidatus Sulfotelmatobacter sp.]